jgi:hypothetical protein
MGIELANPSVSLVVIGFTGRPDCPPSNLWPTYHSREKKMLTAPAIGIIVR